MITPQEVHQHEREVFNKAFKVIEEEIDARLKYGDRDFLFPEELRRDVLCNPKIFEEFAGYVCHQYAKAGWVPRYTIKDVSPPTLLFEFEFPTKLPTSENYPSNQ